MKKALLMPMIFKNALITTLVKLNQAFAPQLRKKHQKFLLQQMHGKLRQMKLLKLKTMKL